MVDWNFLSKFNKQVGSNKSGEDGKNFICVAEKKKAGNFLEYW